MLVILSDPTDKDVEIVTYTFKFYDTLTYLFLIAFTFSEILKLNDGLNIGSFISFILMGLNLSRFLHYLVLTRFGKSEEAVKTLVKQNIDGVSQNIKGIVFDTILPFVFLFNYSLSIEKNLKPLLILIFAINVVFTLLYNRRILKSLNKIWIQCCVYLISFLPFLYISVIVFNGVKKGIVAFIQITFFFLAASISSIVIFLVIFEVYIRKTKKRMFNHSLFCFFYHSDDLIRHS